MKLSVIIPCYNEADNIPFIIDRLLHNIMEEAEVILVNNGSTDATEEVLKDELSKKAGTGFIRVLKVERNQGYGHGIKAGLKEAKGEILAWTHADLQTDVQDVFRAYELYTKYGDRNCFIMGRRESRDLIDNFFTRGMGFAASLALGQNMEDINSQPKLFHRTFLDELTRAPDDFSLDLYALFIAKRNNMIIWEIPVVYGQRKYGYAKGGGSLGNKWALAERTLKYILQLRKDIKQGIR